MAVQRAPKAPRKTRPTDERLAVIERDARRDEQAYSAVLEIEQHLKGALRAVQKLAEAHVVVENPGTDHEMVYRLAGHVSNTWAEPIRDAIATTTARVTTVKEKIDIRVEHRPTTWTFEAAFLWRARLAGFDQRQCVDRLLEMANPLQNQRASKREAIRKRVKDDYEKAAAAADERFTKMHDRRNLT